jgi:hypothetical protein
MARPNWPISIYAFACITASLGSNPDIVNPPRVSSQRAILRYVRGPVNRDSSQKPPSDGEAGQVDQGSEDGQEPLVAQGQPAEPSLEPGEEALCRPPRRLVGDLAGRPAGHAWAAFAPWSSQVCWPRCPAGAGDGESPWCRRRHQRTAPLASSWACPSCPQAARPPSAGWCGGIVAVGRAQGHGQGQARRRHQGVHLAPLAPGEAVHPYCLPPFLASMVASTATAPSLSRPA